MILVFDSISGEESRAGALRELLFAEGFPCASADGESIRGLCPASLIVTFPDQVDLLRRMPYDHIPIVAFGRGFVNRALNALQAETVPELFGKINETLQRVHQIEVTLGDGAFLRPGIFVSPRQLVIYGSTLSLTDTEFAIVKCLLFSEERSAEQLAAYCCANPTSGDVGGIRVHISNINRKAREKLPCPLILSKSAAGYSIEPGRGKNSLCKK